MLTRVLIMDSCFIDLTLEFLAVSFHNILFYTSVYPESAFETRKKYSIVVHYSTHPAVQQYIDLCLKNVAECLKTRHLNRIEFAVTDSFYKPVMKFVFDFSKNELYDETEDAYLVQCEQNLRAFCLNLASQQHKFVNSLEDKSFSIFLHTNESSAVSLSTNADLEDFPLVEVNEKQEDMEKVIPLRRFSIRSCNLDTYIML